jgi:hypothetical protein
LQKDAGRQLEAVSNVWLHIGDFYYATFVRIGNVFPKAIGKLHVITKYSAKGRK